MTTPKKPLIIIGAVFGLCAIGFVAARVMVVYASPTPNNLGVSNGNLAPCPPTPNCVSSQAEDAEHFIAPINFSTSAEDARANLLGMLVSVPHIDIVENQPTYIRAETQSPIFGFVDDNEFYIDEEAGVIHIRAAARLGYSDLNKNRERMEAIRAAFNSVE